jgi:hypothetical protein
MQQQSRAFLGTCAPEQEEIGALIPYRQAYDANLASFRQLEGMMQDVKKQQVATQNELAETKGQLTEWTKLVTKFQAVAMEFERFGVAESARRMHTDNRWRRYVEAAQLTDQQKTLGLRAWDQYGDQPTPAELKAAEVGKKPTLPPSMAGGFSRFLQPHARTLLPIPVPRFRQYH